MTATASDPAYLIPDPDDVRRRLSEVMTEAALLKQQLRVSARLERERERLRLQAAQPGGGSR